MNFKLKLIAVALTTAGLTACGGGSSNSTPAPTPAPAPAPTPAPNTAPTAIAVSTDTVAENATGARIGDLSATDADANDTFTFAVEGDVFTVSGNTLSLADNVSLNYEDATTQTVNVTVTDSANNTFTQALTINVEDVLDTYTFASRFVSGESSVNYSGQTARQAQIAQLNHYISNTLQGELDTTNGPLRTRQDVINKLYSFFHLTSDSADTTATDGLGQSYTLYSYDTNAANIGAGLAVTFEGDSQQATIGAISGSHKDLRGKLAGNDASRMHKDWNDGSSFVGWPGATTDTPTKLVGEFFKQLADNAEAELDGTVRRDEATNTVITKVYVNTNGTDLKQLIQKFLLMGVNFSQGTDDYLDNGLKVNTGTDADRDNTQARSSGATDTLLEHGYDEGFGYFGAASDYLEYSDDEIASKDGS